jgi:hypothetical protein
MLLVFRSGQESPSELPAALRPGVNSRRGSARASAASRTSQRAGASIAAILGRRRASLPARDRGEVVFLEVVFLENAVVILLRADTRARKRPATRRCRCRAAPATRRQAFRRVDYEGVSHGRGFTLIGVAGCIVSTVCVSCNEAYIASRCAAARATYELTIEGRVDAGLGLDSHRRLDRASSRRRLRLPPARIGAFSRRTQWKRLSRPPWSDAGPRNAHESRVPFVEEGPLTPASRPLRSA